MKTPPSTTLRDPLFDVVKAVMMLCVVWGHLGLWGIVAQEPGSLVRMANAKSGVNMPVFFVIGGYLALFDLQEGLPVLPWFSHRLSLHPQKRPCGSNGDGAVFAVSARKVARAG